MKYLQWFETKNEPLGRKFDTPFVGFSHNDKKITFASTKKYGAEVRIVKDSAKDSFKPEEEVTNHGGVIVSFNLTGEKNNMIGSSKIYNALDTLYVDGEVFDIDDLIIVTGGGSGSGSSSGSGSGAGMSGIALPNTYTGDHIVEFILDSTVTSIYYKQFKGCEEIKLITLNSQITRMSPDIIPLCSSFVIGSDTLGICDNMFSNISGATSVVIDDGITTVGSMSFYHCSGLTNIIMPDSVYEIGNSAFQNCQNLTSVTISNIITLLPQSAFNSCTSLNSIKIPNLVSKIGIDTFKNCTSLSSVTLSDSITEIGGSAFGNCTSLSSVNYKTKSYTDRLSLLNILNKNGVTVGTDAFPDFGDQ